MLLSLLVMGSWKTLIFVLLILASHEKLEGREEILEEKKTMSGFVPKDRRTHPSY